MSPSTNRKASPVANPSTGRQSLRRPPSPSGQWATVTRLAPGRTDQRDTVPVAAVQGTLALDLRGCLGMPETPELRLVKDNRSITDDVHAWSARFAQAVVEVLGGDRPLSQLIRWTTARVYGDLGHRVTILGRTSPADQRRRTIRPQVRTVHVFQPTADSAEVSVHVRHGQRSRAIAARLELGDGRWRCTEIQLG